VGVLSPFAGADTVLWYEALRRGLRDAAWVEGKNIAFDYRHADGKNDRLPELGAGLVRLKVDVIVTCVTPDAQAAKNATPTIPIVMASRR
jgi:putative ABC transport system substrate-binding protein